MNFKPLFRGLLALSLLSFNVAALADDVMNVPAANGVYTEDKQNIFISNANPTFTIKVKSNPTTGYSWFLREYDNNLISPIKHSYQAPSEKLVGAPGYELWTFRIKPAGFVVPQQTSIRLIYTRPWQSADSANQIVFRVTTGK